MGLWALLGACALVPIWSVHWLPLLDLPNHLASVAIWHHHGDPAWGFTDSYKLQLSPYPYFLFHFPLHLLAYLVPLPIAGKIYLSIYALLLPLGVGALASALGRPRALGLCAFPFVWSWPVIMGWVAFTMALAVSLHVLAWFVRAADEPVRPWRIALLTLGACATYLLHVLPWGLLGIAALLVALSRLRTAPPRRLASILAALLPSAVLAALETKLGPASGVPFEGTGHWQARYEPWRTAAREAGHRLIDVSQDRADEIALALVGATIVLSLALAVVARVRREPTTGRGRDTIVLLALLGVAATATLWGPVEIQRPFHMWQVGSRFVLVGALLLCALPAVPLHGWRALVLVPALVAGALQPLALAGDFREMDRAVDGFDTVLGKIPLGADTIAVMNGDLTPAHARVRALRMFPQWVQVERGGANAYNFAVGFPMAYTRERPAPSWMAQEAFSWTDHGPYWDYVLTYREAPPRRPPPPRETPRGDRVVTAGAGAFRRAMLIREPPAPPPPPWKPHGDFQESAAAGPWRLYKNASPKRAPPPGWHNQPNR